MALSVSLNLKAAGQDIQGESTISSLGRENTIECLEFHDAVRTAREASTGLATGDRTYEPIRIRKRIDKSTPLLAKALCNNEEIEGKFRFFRPSPGGDGTTQHFYTVEIKKGRISEIARTSPDMLDPASSKEPPTEWVHFVFSAITWTFEDGGVTHHDEWSART